MKNNLVVYSALAGEGRVADPYYQPKGVDYIIYTDQPIKSKVWEVRPFIHNDVSNVAKAKRIKFFPFLLFPHRYSLWVDHHILIKARITVESVKRTLAGNSLAMYQHDLRNCVYEEYSACLNEKKAEYKSLLPQIEHYQTEGYPIDSGLHTAMVMYRDNDKSATFMSKWWEELTKWGHWRDQMSLDYMAWREKEKITTLKGNVRDCPQFTALKFASK